MNIISELGLLCSVLQELPDLGWDMYEGDIELYGGTKSGIRCAAFS
jgi:hypothetical protein